VKELSIAEIADKLITTGRVQPMILVAPDCHNAYRGSWYANSPVTGNWEDFVTRDLVHCIDAEYRTIPNRTSRGIAGHSMGGHGAIRLAMKHPELHSALYAMSPAWDVFAETIKNPYTTDFIAARTKRRDQFGGLLWRAQACIALAAAIAPNPKAKPFFGELPLDANGKLVQAAWKKWLRNDLATTMLAKYRDNLRTYKAIAIDAGSKEDLFPMIVMFSKALKKAGAKHSFEMFDGTHVDHVASQFETKVLPLFSRTFQSAELLRAAPAD